MMMMTIINFFGSDVVAAVVLQFYDSRHFLLFMLTHPSSKVKVAWASVLISLPPPPGVTQLLEVTQLSLSACSHFTKVIIKIQSLYHHKKFLMSNKYEGLENVLFFKALFF